MADGWPHPFLPPSLILRFYFYIYSTARRVRPGTRTATNQFDRRVGNGVRSRLGSLDLSWGLRIRLKGLKMWVGRHQPLDGCLIGGRERPVSWLLFLITGPQRIRVGYWIRLAGRPLTSMLFMTLARSLTGPLASSRVGFSDGPRAASPLTKFLSPKLSDLLAYFLLQPRI